MLNDAAQITSMTSIGIVSEDIKSLPRGKDWSRSDMFVVQRGRVCRVGVRERVVRVVCDVQPRVEPCCAWVQLRVYWVDADAIRGAACVFDPGGVQICACVACMELGVLYEGQKKILFRSLPNKTECSVFLEKTEEDLCSIDYFHV